MGPLGVPELIVIFVVALLVFGPKKLPELGKSLGKGLREFKRATDDIKSTWEDQIRDAETSIKDVKDTVKETTDDIKKDLKQDFQDMDVHLQAELDTDAAAREKKSAVATEEKK
jgi:sec-independent protein translocase protein TatA